MATTRRFIRSVLVVGFVSIGCIAQAAYESDGYVLDGAGWRSVPATGEATDYSLNGSVGFGQGGFDSSANTLRAGSSDPDVAPTPPAPILSVVTTQTGTLHLVVVLGANDPDVLVQVRLTDGTGVVRYVSPSGSTTNAESWSPYVAWDSSQGRDLTSLSSFGYRASVRLKEGDFTLSEWSDQSASVTPLSSVGKPVTPLLGIIKLPASVENLVTAVHKALQKRGLVGVAQAVATLLVPITALAVLSQIASMGGLLFEVLFAVINRLLGALLSGLQFLAFYRKRRVFGVVYDGTTRQPLRGATVEVMTPNTRRLIDSQTTDEKGRYYFLEDPHTSYVVRIHHPRFEPLERTVRGHVNMLVYLGSKIEYDPVRLLRQSARGAWLNRINAVRLWLLVVGTVAWATLLFGDYANWVGYALGWYYIAAWSLELYVRRQPRPYGLVINAATGEVLGLVVVRVVNNRGKVVSTLVCDDQGRFATWLQPGVYDFAFSKAGFKPTHVPSTHISRSLKSLEVTARLQPV